MGAVWSEELERQVSEVAWTFHIQTAAFGAVLLLNVLNLGMRQHLLPFKCNLLLLFINVVAFTTDLLLWLRATTITTTASSGRMFAPLRYLQWCHSTPSMLFMLGLMSDCGGWQLVVPLLSDVAMVLTGLAACYTTGLANGFFTVVSFATFAVVMYYVYGMFQKALSGDVSPEQRGTLRTVLALLLALWSAFPVVWLAADWHLLSPQAEAVCWGVCDYLAKVVFSSQLWQSNLTGVQQRRDRALEAWEASNRVEAVERLTALLEQRDDLLSTLSHELRTPLAGIVALTEALYKDVTSALPSSAHTVATVRATATCMLNIVTSTLDSFAPRNGASVPAAAAAGLGQLPKGPDGSSTAASASAGTGAAVPQRRSCDVTAQSVVDLRPLIETVTSVLRPLAQDGVAVVNDLPGHLPMVSADATRLSQVLYNLVGNAMRFTCQGEVRITARLILPEGAADTPADGPAPDHAAPGVPADATAMVTSKGGARLSGGGGCSSGGGGASGLWRYRRPRQSLSSNASTASSCSAHTSSPPPPGSQVEVSVEDTGVGIPQHLLDELFLPYRTRHPVRAGGRRSGTGAGSSTGSAARAATSAIGGTGLGLYLVRLALRAQGSDITAESAPGLGSVFRFRLPVAPPHMVAHYLQRLQQEAQQQEQLSGGDRKRRQKKDQQQQQPQQTRQQQLIQDDTAHHTGLGAAYGGDDSCEAVDGDQVGEGAEGAVAGLDTADGVHQGASSAPQTPWASGPWVASAGARSTVAGGCGIGASGTAAVPGSPLAWRLLQERPHRPASEAAPFSKRLERLRRSLDEQRRLRLTAAEPAGATATFGAGTGATLSAPCAPGRFSLLYCSTGAGQDCEGLCALPQQRRHGAASGSGSGVDGRCGANGTCGAGTAAAAAGSLEMDQAPVAQALAPAPRNYRHLNKGTLQVLSVDDDPINQLVANQMLTSQSWKVVKCMNGLDALAHLRLNPRPSGGDGEAADGADDNPRKALAAAITAARLTLSDAVLPDCVLLDVMMPGMSGFEVCRRLREHFSPAQLPVIIVSAKGDAAAVEEAFESGADDYMTKPYKRTEMVARIKAQIRIRDSVAPPAAICAAAAPATTTPAAAAVPAGPCPNCGARAPPAGAAQPTVTAAGVGTPQPETQSQWQPQPQLQVTAGSAGQASSATLSRLRYPSNVARVLMAPEAGGSRHDRPASVDAVLRKSAEGRDRPCADGASTGTGVAESSRFRPADSSRYPRYECGPGGDTAGAFALSSQEQGEGRSFALAANAATAPAAVMSGPRPDASPLPDVPDKETREPSPPRTMVVVDASTHTSAQLLRVVGMPTTTTLPPDAPTSGLGAAGIPVQDHSSPAALLQEVLSEVRRSRVAEAELAKMHSRIAALQTTCSTLAAERDGWRRQARELRALLAAGLGGGSTAGAVALPVLTPSALPASSTGIGAKECCSTGGGCYTSQLGDAMAAAHASRSSADSGCFPALPPPGVPVAAGPIGIPGSAVAANVAAQLEDLKREAARLRQQLSDAMASVGNGSNMSTGFMAVDTSNSSGLAAGAAGIRSAVESGLLRPAEERMRAGAAAAGPGAACDSLLTVTGASESNAAAANVAGARWNHVTVIPNPAFAAGPEMFFTTQNSGVSAASGGGARCALNPNDPPISAGVTRDGTQRAFVAQPADMLLSSLCEAGDGSGLMPALLEAPGPPAFRGSSNAAGINAAAAVSSPRAVPIACATSDDAAAAAAAADQAITEGAPGLTMAAISLPCHGGGGRSLAASCVIPGPARTTGPCGSPHLEEDLRTTALAGRCSSVTAPCVTNSAGPTSVNGNGIISGTGGQQLGVVEGEDATLVPQLQQQQQQLAVVPPPPATAVVSPPVSNSAARCSAASASSSSVRGSLQRACGGSSSAQGGGGGGVGILRLLCSKGALPSVASPGTSPH